MEKKPHHSVFWVFAASSARFEQSYIDIASQADLKTSETLSALQAVHRWLSHEQQDWTLILDNLDSYRMLIESSSNEKTLMDYLPITDAGTIVVTSRSRAAASDLVSLKNMLLVGSMDEQDSIQLLRDKTEIDDEEAAKKLIHAVESLPLAITHAGSFIASRTPRWTVSKYLKSLETEKSQVEILYRAALSDKRRDSSSARTIQATFQISFIALLQDSPGAAQLLSLMSMFQNQYIPEELLISRDETGAYEDDRIDILEKYSLVVRTTQGTPFNPSLDPPHRTISIHRAVHMSLRLWLKTKGELGRWQSESIATVEKTFPLDQTVPTSEALSRRLLPHAEQVISYGLQPDDSADKISLERDQCKVRLMLAMIQYWQHVGQDSTHQDFCKVALDLSLRVFSVDSKYNLMIGCYHNNILYNSGERERAMIEQRRLIALAGDRTQEEIYFLLRRDFIEFLLNDNTSAKHSIRGAVLLARYSLSKLNKATMDFWHRYRYRFALLLAELLEVLEGSHRLHEAELILRGALAEKEQLEFDPIYWELISQLASVCETIGDLAEAEKLYSELVQSGPHAYEYESKRNLENRYSLSTVLVKMGRVDEAAKLQISLVDDHIHTFGEGSIPTLAVMRDCAISVFRTGRREEGLKMLRRANDLAMLYFGPTHRRTREIAHWRANCLEELHKWNEAEVPWSAMLAAQRANPMAEEPSINDCLFSLIVVLEHQEKWEEAEQVYRELVKNANETDIYVESHNYLSDVRIIKPVSNVRLKTRLFNNLVKQAKWEEVRAMYLQLMESEGKNASIHAIDIEYGLSMRLFDLEAQDHALVVLRSALAMALEKGDRVAAEPMLNALINELEKDEKWEEAEPLYRRLLNIHEDLDDNLSDVSVTMESLMSFAHNLVQQQKFSEAEKLLRKVLVATEAIYESKGRVVRQTLIKIGGVLMSQYRYSEAEDFYRKSLSSDNTYDADEAQFRMGVALYLQGLYVEAEKTFAAIFRDTEDDQSEENTQDRDDDKDTQSKENHDYGEDNVQSAESHGDGEENAESEVSYEDENKDTRLVRYDRARSKHTWNKNDANENDADRSAGGYEDRDEDTESEEESDKTEEKEDFSAPWWSAVWLHASIRAQYGGNPSQKVEPDLQTQFNSVITQVQKRILTNEEESLQMPVDLIKIWTISHELGIQKKYQQQRDFKKKHGIAEHRAATTTRSSVRLPTPSPPPPHRVSSSRKRRATTKASRSASSSDGFPGKLKKQLS